VLEGKRPKSKWVFTAGPSQKHPRGDGQIDERRLLQSLKRVLARLKLLGQMHTFRHSFISSALVSGVPEAMVRTWVGHVDPEVIRQYTHIADEASRSAMERFAAASGVRDVSTNSAHPGSGMSSS
jgi:integrase